MKNNSQEFLSTLSSLSPCIYYPLWHSDHPVHDVAEQEAEAYRVRGHLQSHHQENHSEAARAAVLHPFVAAAVVTTVQEAVAEALPDLFLVHPLLALVDAPIRVPAVVPFLARVRAHDLSLVLVQGLVAAIMPHDDALTRAPCRAHPPCRRVAM